VEVAVQKLKNYEAPRTDNIPAELFRYGGNVFVKHLTYYYKVYLTKGKNANGMECEYNFAPYIKREI